MLAFPIALVCLLIDAKLNGVTAFSPYSYAVAASRIFNRQSSTKAASSTLRQKEFWEFFNYTANSNRALSYFLDEDEAEINNINDETVFMLGKSNFEEFSANLSSFTISIMGIVGTPINKFPAPIGSAKLVSLLINRNESMPGVVHVVFFDDDTTIRGKKITQRTFDSVWAANLFQFQETKNSRIRFLQYNGSLIPTDIATALCKSWANYNYK